MPSNRKPRIAINPSTLRALNIWGAMVDLEPNEVVDKIIMDTMPPEVKIALDHMPSKGSLIPLRDEDK